MGQARVRRLTHVLGETQVENVRAIVGAYADVGGLHVPVQDAATVGVGDGIDNLLEDLQSPLDRSPGTGSGGPRRHGLALDPFHDEQRSAIDLEQLVDTHDAGMVELAREAELACEAPACDEVGSHESLDRDERAVVGARAVDDSLATATDLLQELVWAKRSEGAPRGGQPRPLQPLVVLVEGESI